MIIYGKVVFKFTHVFSLTCVVQLVWRRQRLNLSTVRTCLETRALRGLSYMWTLMRTTVTGLSSIRYCHENPTQRHCLHFEFNFNFYVYASSLSWLKTYRFGLNDGYRIIQIYLLIYVFRLMHVYGMLPMVQKLLVP